MVNIILMYSINYLYFECNKTFRLQILLNFSLRARILYQRTDKLINVFFIYLGTTNTN